MQADNAPSKVYLPFATSGTKNTIPIPSQISVTPGKASFADGFPPLTFTPVASGGVPPFGADFNGILNAITAIQQWQCGGGLFGYDATWSSDNSGYAKGSLLVKGSGPGFWLNLSDSNATDPDTGGAGWIGFDPATVQSGAYFTAPDTGTVNALAITLSPAPAALTPGMMVAVDNIVATNTGAATLNVNGLGALPIGFAGLGALQGGELVTGYGALLRLNHAGTTWVLLASTGASVSPTPAPGDDSTKNATTAWVVRLFGGSITPSASLQPQTVQQVFSTGVRMQTGSFSAVIGTDGSITFPTAFPTACASIDISMGYGSGYSYALSYNSRSPTGFTYHWSSFNATTGAGNTCEISYTAWGY